LAMICTDVAFNQDMRAFVAASDVNPRYVYYWLRNNEQILLSLVTDSTHGTKRIPVPDLLDINLPLPSLSAQDGIVGILVQLDDGVRALQKHRGCLMSVKQRLTSSLLPG